MTYTKKNVNWFVQISVSLLISQLFFVMKNIRTKIKSLCGKLLQKVSYLTLNNKDLACLNGVTMANMNILAKNIQWWRLLLD